MSEAPVQLARQTVRGMRAYASARSTQTRGEVFLDANESPAVLPGGGTELNRYPEPQPAELVARLATLYGVEPSSLLVGRGADEAIDTLIRTFCEPGQDAIGICPPTYGVYAVAAALCAVSVVEVPLDAAFRLRPEAVIEAVGAPVTETGPAGAVKLVFVCSPNNPTGNLTPLPEIAALCAALKDRAVVVVDEAYLEFSGAESAARLLPEHGNLVVLRTLSKAWGLAGARVGAALAHPELIALMQKVRAPYPLSRPAVTATLAVLREGAAACAAALAAVPGRRDRLASRLAELPGVERVFPSDANFLLVRLHDVPAALSACLDAGVILRDRSDLPGLEGCVRITLGSDGENERLLELLSALPGSKGQPAVSTQEPEDRLTILGEPPTHLRSILEAQGVAFEVVREAVSRPRTATVERATAETRVTVSVDLDGSGTKITTGLGFFDHMLEQLGRHGGFALTITASGDLQVDEHHTVEDVALTLGAALREALGDKHGIGRYGFLLPMDESLAEVALDLSGRAHLEWSGSFSRERVGDLPTELVPHFFRSLADALGATLHLSVRGENSHHQVEACFKGVARALRAAMARSGDDLPSTKGVL